MQCERFLANLSPYLEDRLEEAERAAWRNHFRTCPQCRGKALEQEPSLLLLLAEAPEPDGREVERRLTAAMTAARGARIERLVRTRRLRRWAAAAVLLLGAGLGSMTLLGGHDGDGPVPAARAAVQAESPAVEVEMGAGVTVYQLAEDNDPTTTVAFVVDPEMRL